MLPKKIDSIISSRLFLLIIFVQGCVFGFSNKEAENMLQEVAKRISETGKTMSTNDIKEVHVENIPGIDIAVFCQAYAPVVEIENRLRTLQISPATIKTIQTLISAQDGIYLFLLKKGRIIAMGPLSREVSLSKLVLSATLQNSLSIEVMRLDQKWRYLQIRKISSENMKEKGSDLEM